MAEGQGEEAEGVADAALPSVPCPLALAAYARQAKDPDMVTWATEIKLRAERRAGELLRETAEAGSRNTSGKPSSRGDGLPTLKDLGISRDQSSDWQKLAAIPQPHVDRLLKSTGDGMGPATTSPPPASGFPRVALVRWVVENLPTCPRGRRR